MILNILLAIAFFYMLYRISVIVHEWFKDAASEEEHQDWWSYCESQRQKSEKKKKKKK
jgi:DNA repair photolyase